ncbi:MAG: DnaA regulatory inactivator Hda [Rudaea sp.]
MSEQLILDLARPEPPTFANFVAGGNREALAALASLATGRSRETGVLLWGAPGAGKSHLLQATAEAAATAGRPVILCATPNDLATARELAPSSLLIVDAIDTADPSAQATLFTLVNQLAGLGQWLAAAATPPARLALRDDLRTRLALGLVLEVLALADADKPQALAAYARERGFRLPDDVIEYLLAHGRRDMPSLVATLAALDRHSLATRRGITVPLLRQWLQREPGPSG